MGQIVNWDHYRTARVLMTILRGDAEAHAERMVSRMARRQNPAERDHWQGIAEAVAELQRKKRPRCA